MNEPYEERIVPADGRLVTIDILRGLAILWVVVYHLWGMSTQPFAFLPQPRSYYESFLERLRGGDAVPAFTAFTDLLFRLGNNGVTVFMVLSGVSLMISTMRSGRPPVLDRFYPTRLRKLLLPYWAALALYVLTIAAMAVYRVQADGGTFAHNFEWYGLIHQGDFHQLIAGLLMFPRVLDVKYLFAPAPALWFVPLLLQYYLLFPPLRTLLLRWGSAKFAAVAFALSTLSTAWLVWEYGSVGAGAVYWGGLFPFRLFEFAVGMSIGYAMVEYPAALRRLSRHIVLMAALVLGGVMLHTTGSWIDDSYGYWNAVGYQLITLGFAGVVLALVVCRPGIVLTSPVARVVAWVGPISYTVLIINESFRIVNTYLIVQGYQWTAGWWFFVIVLYVPLTVILAYPLAAVLGLLPKPPRVAPGPAGAVGALPVPPQAL